MLAGWIAINLERGNQSAQPRCKEDQIASACTGGEGMRNARGHKHRHPGASCFRPTSIAKRQFTLQYVPSLVIGVVDMKCCRAATAPLMDAKRVARGGEKRRSHPTILLWDDRSALAVHN